VVVCGDVGEKYEAVLEVLVNVTVANIDVFCTQIHEPIQVVGKHDVALVVATEGCGQGPGVGEFRDETAEPDNLACGAGRCDVFSFSK
jgi:hypothetical protein